MKTTIPSSIFGFLKTLAKHNNREWFNSHKDEYLEAYEHMIRFAEALHAKMLEHDHIEDATGKKLLFRIYADTRFSKDKNPYKTHWAGHFRRSTKKLRGGYYFHIEPGNTYVAGGFFGPNPEDLKRIREDIDMNHDEWRKVLAQKQFVKLFGAIQGEQVATAPKGYTKDHPAIDLLRLKQFIVKRTFTDQEVMAPDFISKVNETFRAMRPYFDHMSEILTTDANGVLIV